MLIRFYTENYLSFAEETEFSMIAGKGLPHDEQVLMPDSHKWFPVLKGAVLYGANASGKSNLIKAISAAREMIVELPAKNDLLPNCRFKLQANCRKIPTKFEFEFIIHKTAYVYGFTFMPEKVEEEWLCLLKKESDVLIYKREKEKIEFNKSYFSNTEEYTRLKFIFQDSLPNQLFLTSANSRNIGNMDSANSLIEVYKWFKDSLNIFYPDSRILFRGVSFYGKNYIKMLKFFLTAFDTGISDIYFEEMSEEEIIARIPAMYINNIEKKLHDGGIIHVVDNRYNYFIFKKKGDDMMIQELKTHHKGDAGNVSFRIEEESDGTKRLIDFIPLLMGPDSYEKVIIIDEIDCSLHTELTYKLLHLFLHVYTGNNSQLIATTHDVNLLNLNLLRKDEIWFVEKDISGKSKLYSLFEFKPRNDLNIGHSYLKGRFGAIPALSPKLDHLVQELSH